MHEAEEDKPSIQLVICSGVRTGASRYQSGTSLRTEEEEEGGGGGGGGGRGGGVQTFHPVSYLFRSEYRCITIPIRNQS